MPVDVTLLFWYLDIKYVNKNPNGKKNDLWRIDIQVNETIKEGVTQTPEKI